MSINESPAYSHSFIHSRRDSPPPAIEWQEIDGGVLQDRVGSVPLFPLDLLPAPWRDWTGETARSVGAPADYVAQAVLAAAAGLGGARVRIRISPVWEEPLQLWLALVGPPSSGKSPALASVRRLLGSLEGPGQQGNRESGPHIISGPCPLDTIAKVVGENKRSVMLWRDEPSTGLAVLGTGRSSGELATLPVNVLCALEPDRLAHTPQRDGEGMAARFLYAWPHQPAYCRLADRKPADDDEASSMLRRIQCQPGSPRHPLLLIFDESGVQALDGFLENVDADRREIEGLEAAWLGKGGGTVARLAGALELLDWSAEQTPNPRPIGAKQVERAAALWLEYFWPHAKAFLDRAVPTDVERRARRVVRWLKATGVQEVSREDIRRHALGRTVDAVGADAVLSRLTGAGVVECLPLVISPDGGRPAWRWQVNPALATLHEGRTTGKGAKGANPDDL